MNLDEKQFDPDEKKLFDFKGIQPTFEELLLTTSNKLEREFPRNFGKIDSANVMYMFHFRICLNTYNAIMYLCADTPKDTQRLPEFALVVPPLVRTIYEEFITIIFLLHNTKRYVDHLFKTEYNEKKKDREAAMKFKAGLPEWDAYIVRLEEVLKQMESNLNLTEAEFKKIGGYPTPGQMIAKLRKDIEKSTALPFLEFIHTFIYRKLSRQTHHDIKGLQEKSIHFSSKVAKEILGENYKEELNNRLHKYASEQIFTTFVLLLAVMSELNWAFNFGLNQRLIYIWVIFNEFTDWAKDMYKIRYKDLLNSKS